MRSFIAIDCEKKLKENLTRFVKKLDNGTGHVRWAKSQGMHLTLKFLGDITDRQHEAIDRTLELLTRKFKPFDLSFIGTGSFPPSSRSPKVLWIGVENNETLFEVHRDIELSLAKLGFPKEKRSFFPHLTLGRVKKSHQIEPILAAVQKNINESFGKMPVDRLTLFKSVLKPTGAEYTVLSEYILQ